MDGVTGLVVEVGGSDGRPAEQDLEEVEVAVGLMLLSHELGIPLPRDASKTLEGAEDASMVPPARAKLPSTLRADRRRPT